MTNKTTNMKRFLVLLLALLAFGCSFAQVNKIYYERDLNWAKWVFTTMEFRADYTIVKGFFVPGEGGCWTRSTGEERLVADSIEYPILESTLFNYGTYKENDTIYFEDKFQPIVKPSTIVAYTSESINFLIQKPTINISNSVRERFSYYGERMIYWKNQIGYLRCYSRYLTFCANEIQEMEADSACVARDIIKDCYNIHSLIGNSGVYNLNNNLDLALKVHYNLTGHCLSSTEKKYWESIADYVYKVQWNKDLENTDSLAIFSNDIDNVFKEEDRNTPLFHGVLSYLGLEKYTSKFDLPKGSFVLACEKYDNGEYQEACRLWPNLIYFKYKTLSEESFVLYCDSIYRKSSLSLSQYINSPFLLNTLVTASGFYTDTWSFLYMDDLQTDLPYFAMLTNHESIIKNSLNGIILAKNYKLYAESFLRNQMSNRNDEVGMQMYDDIQTELAKLEAMYQKGQRDEAVYLEKNKIKELKIRLSEYLKKNRINTNEFAISWESLRTYLKGDEVAIEFQEVPIWRTDSVCYVAIALKKDSRCPNLYTVLTCHKDYLSSIEKDDVLKLSKQIWEKLEPETKDVKTVYFSPSGILYKYPIEYFTSSDKEFVRLSSTREIVTKKQEMSFAYKSMKLYGGLKYDMTIEDLTEVNKEYKFDEIKQKALYAKRNSRSAIVRAGFRYLEGTLKEIQDIENLAKFYNRKCEVLSGERGTEESLRSISGKKYDLLHFATHGFYWTEEDAMNKSSDRRLSSLMMNYNAMKYTDKKSMIRSGLIFSGANQALRGIELPEDMEDGIATASEISHLDLRGCDLVVLSACQTGLGDVSGEGVFGLQRGFKKAGVKSMLMSLWEVDDEATRMLMTEFYRNYLKGDSKHKSLSKAQDFVKSQSGFEDPEYWAGFILLDGLD